VEKKQKQHFAFKEHVSRNRTFGKKTEGGGSEGKDHAEKSLTKGKKEATRKRRRPGGKKKWGKDRKNRGEGRTDCRSSWGGERARTSRGSEQMVRKFSGKSGKRGGRK